MALQKIYLDDPNISDIEKGRVLLCLDSGYVSTFGPYVEAFEKRFASLLGLEVAVGVQSGTAGLHVCMHELGLQPGDEVIIPVLTFVATVNPVRYLNASPVFVDVDPVTWTIDCDAVESAVTHRTRGIVPVHLYGNPAAMDRLTAFAGDKDFFIVEDATESLGSKLNGCFTGLFGDLAVFSFNGNKMITTGGGGMVVGKDKRAIEHIRYLVNQARDEGFGYFHSEIGFNYRMTNLEASLGLGQLDRFDGFAARKRLYHEIFTASLGEVEEITFQRPTAGADCVWWLPSITVDTKKIGVDISEFQKRLYELGVPTRRIFPPLTLFPPYLDENRNKFPNAFYIYENGLNLPASTLNSADAIEKAAAMIAGLVRKS